ncbi:PREDICTED: serine/arginine repetitive matrix protein 2-like [Gekko japonicus]|uniref:Serine/arginine repetitive matrix protein 2-like n=1 Tax=Gekko japonicus TaxID=146911 RepID=A0ABM1JNQ1_GEKJA|nr:PREDICTED: serine/arginine repetitive matrix protein 2-like [Gekko japonicus]
MVPKGTEALIEQDLGTIDTITQPFVVLLQQHKKENVSEVKEDESAIPKETKAQEDSVASVENTDPPQQHKKENVSEVKEDESAIPKETKQAQEDSVASVENTDPPQVSQEASKAIISPSQFSFRLPPDSLTYPMCSSAKTEDTEMVSQKASKAIISASQFSFRLPPDSLTCPPCSPAKTEDIELIKPGTESKTEDSHQVACCTQAATSELPATLENLELKKEDKEIDLDKLKGTQATKAQPRQVASLPSAKSRMEGQAPSNTAGSFHPVVKEDPMPVPETKQDMNIITLTDLSSVTELSTPSCAVEPPARLETTEALLSLGREEDELLESSQSTDHFDRTDSPPAVEIPFPSDTTDECRSEGKEELELTQMGGSHEDTDCSQACDALAGGTSALPVIPSDVHSVPVLVSGKETAQPYFWESESSLHAPEFNWSDGGKGWAPEDYQEPSWALDKAKKCGDVSEPERNLVLSHSSFHSRYSSDRSPDTGSVLECRSSSSRSRHNSDSKHSSTQRTIKCLRSPLRQGSHSRSPLRRRWHSRSPLRQDRSHSRSPLRRWHSRSPLRQDRSHSRDSSRSSGGREITRTDYCSKCHCKCCQKRFRERVLPHSYSTPKMHRYHPSKETNKSYRTSHSYSPENSTMTRKKKSARQEETKKGRSASVKRKGRSTSVKQVKSSKVKLNGRKVLAPINHATALAVETSIPAETTEHVQSANTEVYESVQLSPSSEDTGFAHQSCARKETGTSAPSRVVEDPRSVAVLTKTNQIEQDYLQVMLNFAVVATMLLQKEPCMEQALEVALRANMRSVGDYYESMLKNFIDNYDLSETH